MILAIFGKTLTNSIYNAAPIVWQVSGANLGRCTIRKISVPRHDPAHLDQYLRVVLLLWTRSKRCRLESCQYSAFGISIEKRPNRVIKLGGIVRHLCTPSSEIPYSGVRGRGEVRVGRTGFRRPNLAAPGWIISDQRVEFDDISPQACRLFQCHRSHPVGTCGK